jgi:hypothetical protein
MRNKRLMLSVAGAMIALQASMMYSNKEFVIRRMVEDAPELEPYQYKKGNGRVNGKRKRNPDRWR